MISAKFDKVKQSYFQKLGQLQALRERAASCNTQIVDLTSKEDITTKASLFLQSLSDQTRLNVLDKISGIVTEALQTVKDKNLEFKMNLVTERNQPTLEMGVLDKTNGQLYDVLESMGGGLADIISLTLRVALLVKWQPSLSRVLILDESAKHVSRQDQELLAEFVKKLSESLNLQILWISHSQAIENSAHKIFEVTKANGSSKVEEKTSSF